MNRKKILISIILILILSLLFILGKNYLPFPKQKKEQITTGVNPGNKAPDFTLESLYGKKIKLSTLQGKKVFLNFWASWCGPCRSEMPDIEKLNENYNKIEILTVNIKEEKKKVLDFIMTKGYTFPVFLDKDGKVSNMYQARGIPTTYIIDEQGTIRARHTGILDYSKMKELLNLENVK